MPASQAPLLVAWLQSVLGLVLWGYYQRWSRGHKARGKAKDKKKSKTKAKDSPSEDRLSWGQRQECSRPRTQTSSVFKKTTNVLNYIFSGDLQKKGLQKFFSSSLQNFNVSKTSAVLEPRTGQFSRTWGFEAKAKDLSFEAKAKDFKRCPRGRPRRQERPLGLHCRDMVKGNNHHFQLFEKIGI